MTKTSTPSLSDDELIVALHSGNQQSFEKFYNRYAQVLYGTIITWINDRHMAENILQDAFIKAWTNRETYDPSKGKLFTWLYNIARNACIDHFRSRNYKKSRAAILSDDLSKWMNTKSVNQMTDSIGIRKLLDLLRHEEKQVVELMYFKGFTQKEIANLMDMPLGTVKTRMSMAIKNLRAFFTSDWQEAQEKGLLNN